jgi:hypothetical protein
MARPPLRSDGPSTKLLLVEGDDDYHLIGHLQTPHNLDNQYVREVGGSVEQILASLPVRLLAANEERLGVVVDADADISNRWASLRNIFIKAGYSNVPLEPDVNGTVVEQEDKPTIGIWIMPDNRIPGMIEDFVRMLVPSEDRLWPRAETAVQGIPEEDRLFGIHVTKATIHTWLAWQKEPGTRMGSALMKNYLRADAPYALLFVDWLRRLFDIEHP